MSGQSHSSVHIEGEFMLMITITEYLERIFDEFKEQCNKGNEGTESMQGLKDYSPRLKSDGSSIYSNQTYQQQYLLKYAYAYGFEYLSMCNELIKDFADKKEISVVSLGCGTMLDYWALVNMLYKRNLSQPIVKYHGIDAVKWNHSLDAKAIGKDEKNYKFSQESFEKFFNEPDNEFDTHDVYFFPKSISEFSNKKEKTEKSDMETLLENLSKIEKETIYFCIALRKKEKVDKSDVKKVQKIIDKMEKETDFHVKEVKCITNKEKTIGELKEKGLCVEDVKFIPLGDEKRSEKKKYVYDEDVAKTIGGYPPYPQDIEDSMPQYIKILQKTCVHSTPKEVNPCKECRDFNCALREANAMKKTSYICDLIIKFERDKTS